MESSQQHARQPRYQTYVYSMFIQPVLRQLLGVTSIVVRFESYGWRQIVTWTVLWAQLVRVQKNPSKQNAQRSTDTTRTQQQHLPRLKWRPTGSWTHHTDAEDSDEWGTPHGIHHHELLGPMFEAWRSAIGHWTLGKTKTAQAHKWHERYQHKAVSKTRRDCTSLWVFSNSHPRSLWKQDNGAWMKWCWYTKRAEMLGDDSRTKSNMNGICMEANRKRTNYHHRLVRQKKRPNKAEKGDSMQAQQKYNIHHANIRVRQQHKGKRCHWEEPSKESYHDNGLTEESVSEETHRKPCMKHISWYADYLQWRAVLRYLCFFHQTPSQISSHQKGDDRCNGAWHCDDHTAHWDSWKAELERQQHWRKCVRRWE